MKVEITDGWDGETRSAKECADWKEARQFIKSNMRCKMYMYRCWRFNPTDDSNKTIVDVGFHDTLVRILGYNSYAEARK